MVERRALFVTSIFSRVEDNGDDNLELVGFYSCPVNRYTIVTYWKEKKLRFSIISSDMVIPAYRIYRFHVSFAKAEK
jgi:hypothetical protein